MNKCRMQGGVTTHGFSNLTNLGNAFRQILKPQVTHSHSEAIKKTATISSMIKDIAQLNSEPKHAENEINKIPSEDCSAYKAAVSFYASDVIAPRLLTYNCTCMECIELHALA